MGNRGSGLMEYSTTTGRLGLGLLGLEGKALGLGALLAHDRDNQLFLGLRWQRVWAKTARQTFDCLDFGDTVVTLWSTALACNVDVREIPAECQGTDGRALARARARLPGIYHLGIRVRNPVFVNKEGYPHFV